MGRQTLRVPKRVPRWALVPVLARALRWVLQRASFCVSTACQLKKKAS